MQQLMGDWERGSLIPPRRLGAALSAARAGEGLTLEDLAARSGGAFSLSSLASIERGSRDVDDDEARALCALYGLESTSLVPPRSRLIVDLDEGLIVVDDHQSKLGRSTPAREEILSRYLTMVYSMRCVEPGTQLVLRVDDLDVLGRALRVGSRSLEADLDALMTNPGDLIGWRARVLRRRVLVPAAGVLVACLGVGALVMVQGAETPSVGPLSTPTELVSELASIDGVNAGWPNANPGATRQVPTDIGSAVVQERNADGSPGPVVVRPLDGSVESGATLIEAATEER